MILCSIKPLKSAFTFLMLALLTGATLAQDADKKSTDDNLKITISKETTWFTEPLTENGDVDYVKAVNRHFSKGATPENNIVTALLKVSGFKYENQWHGQEVLNQLGLKELPEPSECLMEFSEFARQQPSVDFRTDVEEIQDRIVSHMWNKDELPIAAQWIETYSPIVDQYISELENKTTCYSPAVSVGKLKSGYSSVVSTNSRNLASFLAARALMRLHDCDIQGSQDDLVALRNTMHLLSRGNAMVHLLEAYSSLYYCVEAERQMFAHPETTVLHLEDYRDRTADLRFIDNLRSIANVDDRMMALEIALYLKNYSRSMKLIVWPTLRDNIEEWALRSVHHRVNWDFVMRAINQQFDAWVSRMDSLPKNEILKQLQDEGIYRYEQKQIPLSTLFKMLLATGETKSNIFARIYVDVLPKPHTQNLLESTIRRLTQDQLSKLALALYQYRLDYGTFPESLSELQTGYIDEIPIDLYSGQSLIYKRYAEHFIVYAVGPNWLDDGGNLCERDWDFYHTMDIGYTSDPYIHDWLRRFGY